MSDRNLRAVVAVLVVLLILVLGATVVVLSGRNGRNAGTPSPATASAGPSAPGASPSTASSAAATAGPAGSAASTAPSASASASASPPPAPLATVTFLGLKLDPTTGAPGAQPRIVSFRSDGPGMVSAKLATASGATPGRTHMCLQVGAKVIGCNDITSGTFTGKTSAAHANWQVTVQGTATATPDVNLTVTFQSLAPSVKIEHARFDGTSFPDTNGIQARFTTRASGDAHLVADWGGHPFLYEVDLFDETSGTGNVSLANQGPSTNVDQTFPVKAGDWRLVLQNIETGFGTTDLTAMIGWP